VATINTKILAFIALASCQTNPVWQATHMPSQDGARLSYHVQDIVNEVGVQICRHKEQITTHLEVHSQSIPPYQDNPQAALVKLKVENQIFEAVARRHAGGQRLTLPLQLQESLIDNLRAGKTVTLLLEGYSTKLEGKHFLPHYDHLHQKQAKSWFRFSALKLADKP
jgi:hypothetical protein